MEEKEIMVDVFEKLSKGLLDKEVRFYEEMVEYK